MKRLIFIASVVISIVVLITIGGCGKAKVYTVTFDANGGEGKMSPQSFADGVQQALVSNTFTRNDYIFDGWNTMSDGGGTNYFDAQEIVLTEDAVFYAQWKKKTKGTVNLNGHDYVDLGLPSGILWATCNVGATAPEDYGDYFAWGETTPKESYTTTNYKYYDTVTRKYTKYTYSDGLYTLESIDDAATANWGGDWRMPSYRDVFELRTNCSREWTTQNGVIGALFTGPNGNSIFLPSAGQKYGDDISGPGACYWSNYGQEGSSYSIEIVDGIFYQYEGSCMVSNMSVRGFSVRPVCSSK